MVQRVVGTGWEDDHPGRDQPPRSDVSSDASYSPSDSFKVSSSSLMTMPRKTDCCRDLGFLPCGTGSLE
jgi:hypothetical protein